MDQIDIRVEKANDILDTFGQIATWILIVAGWYVVDRQLHKRERRREIRAQIDKCESLLQNLEEIAKSYHCEPIHSPQLASEILTLIQRILRKISYLKLLTTHEYNQNAKAIRRAITLNNFDSTTHAAAALDSQLMNDIGIAIDNAHLALETAFHEKYPD
jgi:hypothetical protein